MADESSSSDKTEEGSEKKTRDALEKGNTPFSREASIFLSLAAMLTIASMMLSNGIHALEGSLASLFANPTRDPFSTTADTLGLFKIAGSAAATFLGPILLVLGASGLAAGMAQGVPRFVLERIRPKWSKLSPAAGIKRLLGRDGQVEFLKNLSKFALVSGVMAIVLRGQSEALIGSMFYEPSSIGPMTIGLVSRLLAGSLVAFSILAGGDLVWARLKWRRDLRMTRQEMKDEMKESEGDPLMKAKRRSLALDRSRRRMMADVPKATLVIVNPTHYAIALRYVREEGGAPIVIAKGLDLIALKIREIAEQAAIPVIEDKALARSMYDHVEVSQIIPAEFYKAIADLILFLQTRSPKGRRPAVKA